MRKTLFFISLLFTSVIASAQNICTIDFTPIPLGDVGNDTTGATANWTGFYLTNGTPADYQIATIDAAHGNSLKILAGPGYVAANDPNTHSVKRLLNVPADPGNNIVKTLYSFYTGAANGIGSIYFTVYDGTAPMIALVYNVATKTMTAGGTLSNNGNRTFASIKQLGTTYAANTWVNVGMAYNKTTGVMTWYTPQETYTFSTPPAGYTLIPNLTVGQFRIYNLNGAGNTVAYDWGIDDINISHDNNTVLATEDFIKDKSAEIQIYPNPTDKFINIKSSEKVSNVEVIDATGRKMKFTFDGDKIDVGNIPSGSYILNIKTENKNYSEKFIKK